MNDSFIMIKHGECGYYQTDIKSPEEANSLNLIEGNNVAELKVAGTCSMFGCWDNFDTMVEELKCKN